MRGCRWCLLWVVAVAAGVIPGAEGAEAPSLEVVLAEVLEANRQLSELAGGLAEENARLRARDAERDAEFERMRADLAVLQRMLFGRSSEKARPGPPGGGGPAGDDGSAGGGDDAGGAKGVKQGPGARAGRRRHYKRACDCRVPATVTAPGPPKAIGKGLFSNGFIAMLLTERFAAGRSMNSLVTGLSRQGAEISAATLAGTCAQAAGLLEPLAGAIAERNRSSWHLHADETTWRVFAPGDGGGPAKWWLWVFIGPDTACFVMDPSRSGQVLARHAGIEEETGQLAPDDDGGPRRLVISSDFYAVYQSAGKKADGLVNLYCWAHVRRHFVRAGDASPVQLKYWTDAWLELIRGLYAAHDELTAAWQENTAPSAREKEAAAARLQAAYDAWDAPVTAIDETRKKQAQGPPACRSPRRRRSPAWTANGAASSRTATTP